MIEREYELLLKKADGKTKIVTWIGIDGITAAKRYMDCKGLPGESIIAWKEASYGVYAYGGQPIID